MLLICVLFFLVSQEVLIVCNSRFLCILFRLLLGLVIIDNWLWICFVDWLILVMFVNGLKCRVLLFRYILFMFLYRDLYLFFMLNIMVKFLEFSMLWISGCISLVLLVLEVLQIVMLQLVLFIFWKKILINVSWLWQVGVSRFVGVRGLFVINGIRLVILKFFVCCIILVFFSCLNNFFLVIKGRQVRKLCMWLKCGEISLKLFLWKLFRMFCFIFSVVLLLFLQKVVMLRKQDMIED